MERTISSVGELIESIRQARQLSAKVMWYRGQANFSWQLLPGLMRGTYRVSESTLLARFKQSASMLISRRPENEFDWIFLMQHHGVPTRLLDWTENPLVALYFAVATSNSEVDGMDASFWILRPSELNRNAHINDKNEGDYIPSFDDEVVLGYSTGQIRSKQNLELLPIATIATRNSPRIQAQLGTFTIHHNDRSAVDSVGNGSHCAKYRIPGNAKTAIRDELSILGVNRFTLFPEMDSIGGILKEMM